MGYLYECSNMADVRNIIRTVRRGKESSPSASKYKKSVQTVYKSVGADYESERTVYIYKPFAQIC